MNNDVWLNLTGYFVSEQSGERFGEARSVVDSEQEEKVYSTQEVG